MSSGIAAWGTYLPYWRLQRSAIAGVLGSGGGRGTRSVASHDEDTTTLGVEAARRALAAGPGAGCGAGPVPVSPRTRGISTRPAPRRCTPRSGSAGPAGPMTSRARRARRSRPCCRRWRVPAGGRTGHWRCVRPADRPGRLGGGARQRRRRGGVRVRARGRGRRAGRAEARPATSSSTAGGCPGEADSHVWEERFGEELYVPLAREAFAAALKDAGLAEGDVDHAVVTGLHVRAVKAAALGPGCPRRRPGAGPDRGGREPRRGPRRRGAVRRARAGRARPGDRRAVAGRRRGRLHPAHHRCVARRAAGPGRSRACRRWPSRWRRDATTSPYATFLTWRGQLRREPPRRPTPSAPAPRPCTGPRGGSTPSWPAAARCAASATCPPTRACLSCHAIDQMQPERLADVPGTVATFTIDHLAFSLSPPVVGVIVDFDGGGRYRCEITDVRADELSIGDRVAMTFRRVWTAQGVHNYFWKARPADGSGPTRGARRRGRWRVAASATRWPSSAWAAHGSASCGTRASTTS